MRVSLSWIFLISLILVLIVMGVKGFDVYEAYTSTPSNTYEGFQGGLTDDLQIRMCPAESKSFIDSEGQTLCCDGMLEGSTCNGRVICSLSEGSKNTPTCSRWYAAYLDEKSQKKCPPSMPNYFESRDGKIKGCTAGRRNADGSGPLEATSKTCKLYLNKTDEDEKADSCTNQLYLESTKCFDTPVQDLKKGMWEVGKGMRPLVFCSYSKNAGVGGGGGGFSLPGGCLATDSAKRFFQYAIDKGQLPRDYLNTLSKREKEFICKFHERLEILKTITDKDLETMKL